MRSKRLWLRGRESSYLSDMARKRAFRIGRSRTGLGLFATAPIKKRAFIVEYKGRKLTTEQANKLEARGNRYLYEINSRWTIDGTSRQQWRMPTPPVLWRLPTQRVEPTEKI